MITIARCAAVRARAAPVMHRGVMSLLFSRRLLSLHSFVSIWALVDRCLFSRNRGCSNGDPCTHGYPDSRGSEVRAFTSKDGTTIGCFVGGSGPPIVLVHGTAADHGRWRPILPALERHFTVYACDRRGRGASGGGQRSCAGMEPDEAVGSAPSRLTTSASIARVR
jgi:hypothetical protein